MSVRNRTERYQPVTVKLYFSLTLCQHLLQIDACLYSPLCESFH